MESGIFEKSKLAGRTLASVLAIWLFALLLYARRLEAQEYSIEGLLTHSTFTLKGEPESRTDEFFRVNVLGRKWLIEEETNPSGFLIKVSYGFDGTNLFQLIEYPKISPPDPKRMHIRLTGNIRNSNLPEIEPPFQSRLIWFALASSNFFQTKNNQKNILPFFFFFFLLFF